MLDNNNFILECKGISKHFGGICALDNVNLEVSKGEIVGLVGDNGAGKSTLVKIISGAYQKDSGEIYIEGKKVEINNPIDAINLKIETIYQDLALIDLQDVSSNIFLGREIKYKNFFGKYLGFLNFKEMNKESEALIRDLSVKIPNLKKPVVYFSGGQRQSVSFCKCVYWSQKIVILDEPTAALGVRESERAMDLIKKLQTKGASIIIISHNLQHIFRVVDRIVVLRRGKRICAKNVHEVCANDIVGLITGAKVIENV